MTSEAIKTNKTTNKVQTTSVIDNTELEPLHTDEDVKITTGEKQTDKSSKYKLITWRSIYQDLIPVYDGWFLIVSLLFTIFGLSCTDSNLIRFTYKDVTSPGEVCRRKYYVGWYIEDNRLGLNVECRKGGQTLGAIFIIIAIATFFAFLIVRYKSNLKNPNMFVCTFSGFSCMVLGFVIAVFEHVCTTELHHHCRHTKYDSHDSSEILYPHLKGCHWRIDFGFEIQAINVIILFLFAMVRGRKIDDKSENQRNRSWSIKNLIEEIFLILMFISSLLTMIGLAKNKIGRENDKHNSERYYMFDYLHIDSGDKEWDSDCPTRFVRRHYNHRFGLIYLFFPFCIIGLTCGLISILFHLMKNIKIMRILSLISCICYGLGLLFAFIGYTDESYGATMNYVFASFIVSFFARLYLCDFVGNRKKI